MTAGKGGGSWPERSETPGMGTPPKKGARPGKNQGGHAQFVPDRKREITHLTSKPEPGGKNTGHEPLLTVGKRRKRKAREKKKGETPKGETTVDKQWGKGL